MSADVRVTRIEEGDFEVEVEQDSETTSHRVRVPRAMLEDLALQDVDQERLVRESFAFLLEREPASSILPEFGLDIISRYFPEYHDELVQRVGAGS